MMDERQETWDDWLRDKIIVDERKGTNYDWLRDKKLGMIG
jgi:hypothetical protein